MTKAEFVSENNITFQVRNLPVRIHGFTYHDDEGHYFVVLNSRLGSTMNKRTAKHELRHIMRGDTDNIKYVEYE